MLRTLMSASLGIALAGCQSPPKPSPVAHFTNDDTGRYEIRLDYTYWSWGVGGPCNCLDLFPEKVDMTDWIYTRSIDGQIPANQLIVAGAQGMTSLPTPVSGSVTFVSGRMHVALEHLPSTNPSASDPLGAYELNGDYYLQPDESTLPHP
jgi:hypothetical protein